jgi:hypothetical protein
MPPAVKGLLLGIANTLAIATANAIAVATNTEVGWSRFKGSPPDPGELFLLVALLGVFPAMFSGLFIGWLAGQLRQSPRWRLAVLALPAVGTVAFLGAATGSLQLIALSCIPTLAATSILERWTRAPATMPSARTT